MADTWYAEGGFLAPGVEVVNNTGRPIRVRTPMDLALEVERGLRWIHNTYGGSEGDDKPTGPPNDH
ncbi:hypothetical protein ABZ215_25075 [Amycolatopsis sp. NPDC006131]|uniref:hypothetical protein n=1 Tax=Amycolatopsis sp. NPDC006131 TaxID=3156731 RepID=UPI0033B8027F